jgi:hypothetical protein
MKSFSQFLAEKQKMVQMYGTGASSTGARFVNSFPKSVKPARPFSGLSVPEIFAKPRKSGIVGENVADQCSLIALDALLGMDRNEMIQMMVKYGLVENGISPARITLLLDELQIGWKVVKGLRNMTPRELQEQHMQGKYLVFVRGHVMPMLNGQISNFCGHGEEPVTMVLSLG